MDRARIVEVGAKDVTHREATAECIVTMTHSGYYPRQSHMHQQFNKSFSSVAGDFRSLAPVVLMAALREAGTQVCEPVHRFELELPTATMGAVSSSLVGLAAWWSLRIKVTDSPS